jgi:hypothetical protein
MTHENLGAADHVKIGSERNFGFVMAGFFALLSALVWWKGGVWYFYLLAAAAFLVAALATPGLLGPMNRLWFRFGMVLNAIISPLVLGLLFFLVITPVGWLMRLFRARPLHLTFERAEESYWIGRDPPGPPPDSLKNQF